MEKILSDKDKVFILGNEAIVRGAIESGVKFASTYPGTPASEIGDAFARIANETGIYFEYSTNEKVALEACAGAALSGIRSMVSFKHYGLNVACDSLFPLAYTKLKAGMVVVFADDPNCWSSAQSEQDSRYFALISHLPMLEPSDPQECKDFVKHAFEISEKLQIPVLLRLTTRVSHMGGIVKLGKIIKTEKKGKFIKDIKMRNFPPFIMDTHKEIHKKLKEVERFAKKINPVFYEDMKSKFGIITSGVSFNYVMESLKHLGIKFPVLKLGLTHPIPENKIKNFIKRLDSVFVVEELEPFLEEGVIRISKEVRPKLKVYGKEILPIAGELRTEYVLLALREITGKKHGIDLEKHIKYYKELKILRRPPVLCPGCPHRATFYAVKSVAGKEATYAGDIGCYILGIFPPIEATDFVFSMGASEGISHGIRKVSEQKTIAFIGDSTFFHAGLPGLINIIYNKSNPLIIILDNKVTAMTGHQPHPGSGVTGVGEKTKEIKIEDIVKACGVENLAIVNPFNLKEMKEKVKEFIEKNEASVIISRKECRLTAIRKMRKEGISIPKFEIDKNICNRCGICLKEFGCPAIKKTEGNFIIDEELCTGCGVCIQVCPQNAIGAKK
ncbi:MAG: indolepyruvate ferredoxin oxidoreductase subunit alpha [Candidatus Aenigmatarchaeota archaeon]